MLGTQNQHLSMGITRTALQQLACSLCGAVTANQDVPGFANNHVRLHPFQLMLLGGILGTYLDINLQNGFVGVISKGIPQSHWTNLRGVMILELQVRQIQVAKTIENKATHPLKKSDMLGDLHEMLKGSYVKVSIPNDKTYKVLTSIYMSLILADTSVIPIQRAHRIFIDRTKKPKTKIVRSLSSEEKKQDTEETLKTAIRTNERVSRMFEGEYNSSLQSKRPRYD